MQEKGFILPFSIILAFVVLSSLGLWYRQVILQGFLAEQLLHQRRLYSECRSLIPALNEKLNGLSHSALEIKEEDFMIVEVDHHLRWRIDRSAWIGNKVRFVFHKSGQNSEPIKLTIPYNREQLSSLPPDFTTEGGRILKFSASGH